MAYGSPAPQPRTDLHRYIILLYEHQGRRIQVPKINSRAKFNTKQFVEKHKLGMIIGFLKKKSVWMEWRNAKYHWNWHVVPRKTFYRKFEMNFISHYAAFCFHIPGDPIAGNFFFAQNESWISKPPMKQMSSHVWRSSISV